jgi:iron complex outermembrane recepter protein
MSEFRSLRILSCVSMLALATAATSASGQTAQSAASEVEASRAAQALTNEDIVVTARGRAERLQDVPIAVSAFDAETIKDAKIDRVGDFINLTPNVTIAQSESSGFSAISIRGVTQVRNSEAPVAVVVDGVLQNNPRQFAQELLDVSAIEVLRGPQGALYGRNATGGAIIISTRQPTNEFRGGVRAGYATGEEYLAEASISGPIIKDKLYFRIGGRYTDRKGYFENITVGRKQDPYQDTSINALLKWTPSDAVTIDLRGSRSRTRGGSLNFRFQPVNLAADGKSLNTANPFDFTRFGADLVDRTFYSNNIGRDVRNIDDVSLKIDLKFDWATLSSISAYNRLEEVTSGDQFPYTATRNFFGIDGTQSQFIEVSAFSQELRLTSPTSQRFRWMIGGYFLSTERFISTATGVDSGTGIEFVRRVPRPATATNPTVSFFADDNKNRNYAGFGNVAYDIAEGLEASFALRYDKETRRQQVSPLNTGGVPGARNRADFEKWQPKVTVAYKPIRSVNIYGSYGEGFRSGQFNQNGTAAAAATAGLNGVADLVPQENTRTFELGGKFELAGGRVRVDGALFDTQVTNQQYFVFIGAIGAQVLVPIDKVRLRGGEIAIAADLAEGLNAYASLGYTDSQILRYRVNPALQGKEAPYVPQTTINVGLQYRAPLTDRVNLVARADYRRLGKQFWDPENSTQRSNIDLATFRLGVEDKGSGLSLTGSVENAFDKRYNSEYVAGGFAHAASPRVWRVDLRYAF